MHLSRLQATKEGLSLCVYVWLSGFGLKGVGRSFMLCKWWGMCYSATPHLCLTFAGLKVERSVSEKHEWASSMNGVAQQKALPPSPHTASPPRAIRRVESANKTSTLAITSASTNPLCSCWTQCGRKIPCPVKDLCHRHGLHPRRVQRLWHQQRGLCGLCSMLPRSR